jgi:hypothetical protein
VASPCVRSSEEPLPRTRWRHLGTALLLLALALCRGDNAAADAPRTLAGLLPAGALAALEVDDLGALLDRWMKSRLRKDFDGSAAERQLEHSRLYLRLERNLAEIEEAAGFSISLERLQKFGGHRSAIALYQLPTTSFVLISELSTEEARASTWFDQKGRLEPREHRGVKYLYREGERGQATLAVALVGNRLLAGTDLPAFRGALVLAARAAGLAVAPPAPGQPQDPGPGTESLAADPRHRALLGAAPPAAPITVWVSGEALASRYFDSYWIFGKADALGHGVRGAWLTLTPGEDLTVETRTLLYAEGKRPAVAAAGTGKGSVVGQSDVPAQVAPLPGGPIFAAAHPTDASAAGAALTELLPLPAGPEVSVKAADALALALTPAGPDRALEVLDPARAKGGPMQHHAGLVLALRTPASFEAARFEAALLGALAPGLGTPGGAPLAFADEGGRRSLKLPLVPASEWSLTWQLRGDRLLVATEAAGAARLAEALGRAEVNRLLEAAAPRVYRLDLGRAATVWRDTTRMLALRKNWNSEENADLFTQTIGGLFAMVKDTRRVLAYGYAQGPDLYVEEVQYRAR